MITKQGEQIKEAYDIRGIGNKILNYDTSGISNKILSPTDRKEYERGYGMKPDSNILLRRAGRSMTGAAIGGIGGRFLGGVAGLALGDEDMAPLLAGAGARVGASTGAWLGSRKYNAGALKKVKAKNRDEDEIEIRMHTLEELRARAMERARERE